EADGHSNCVSGRERFVVASWYVLPPDSRARADDEFRLDRRELAGQCPAPRCAPRVRPCSRVDPRASESKRRDSLEQGRPHQGFGPAGRTIGILQQSNTTCSPLIVLAPYPAHRSTASLS